MYNMNNNILISIEGNIGSGKSTFLNYLKQKHKDNTSVIFLDEPVKDWENIKDDQDKNILELFYDNKKKYSFSFQMLAFISRYKLLHDVITNNTSKIIISERSLFTDEFVFAQMLYDSKDIEEIEFQIYKKWVLSFSTYIPNKIIYISTDPTTALNRVETRSRKGENNISIEYLKSCHSYHDKMIEIIKSKYQSNKCEIIKFDGNIDIFQVKTTFDNWNETINIEPQIYSNTSYKDLIALVNGY